MRIVSGDSVSPVRSCPRRFCRGIGRERVVNTAELDLDAIVALLQDAHAKGQDVARVHSGDPSLYGAIGEQIRRLNANSTIPYEIVPGVTAAAASRGDARLRTHAARYFADA